MHSKLKTKFMMAEKVRAIRTTKPQKMPEQRNLLQYVSGRKKAVWHERRLQKPQEKLMKPNARRRRCSKRQPEINIMISEEK